MTNRSGMVDAAYQQFERETRGRGLVLFSDWLFDEGPFRQQRTDYIGIIWDEGIKILDRRKGPLRFPRTPEKVLKERRKLVDALVLELMLEFPPPSLGPENPGEWVLQQTARCSEDQLRGMCTKHGLDAEGDKHDMVRRLWRHWRASKLEIGFPLWAYGPGFEKVSRPICICGGMGMDSTKVKRFPRQPKGGKKLKKDVIVRFPRRPNTPSRFPRLPEGDPRANDPIWVLRKKKG